MLQYEESPRRRSVRLGLVARVMKITAIDIALHVHAFRLLSQLRGSAVNVICDLDLLLDYWKGWTMFVIGCLDGKHPRMC